MTRAYHGGAGYEVIGNDLSEIDSRRKIIDADVLDAWFDPSLCVQSKILEHIAWALKTSPPAHSAGLILTIAENRGIPTTHILAGGGSSDLIFALYTTLFSHNDTGLILDPMYGEYHHVLNSVLDATVHQHALDETRGFAVDTQSLLDDIHRYKPSCVTIVNSNSPTGQHVTKERMLRFLDNIPFETLCVVDETYIEYVGTAESLETAIEQYENLVIIKSMSKAYALSGARVGYLVAHPTIIDTVSQHMPPWSVSTIGQIAAIQSLNDEPYAYREKYELTHALRDHSMDALREVPGVTLFPSQANFFLMKLGEQYRGTEVLEKLRARGIFLRNCSSMSPRFNDQYMRIAVKGRRDSDRIVSALKSELLGEPNDSRTPEYHL